MNDGRIEQDGTPDDVVEHAATFSAMPDCVKIFAESGELVHINPAGLDLLQAPDLASLSAPGHAADRQTIFQPLRFKSGLEVKNRLFRSNVSGRFDNYDGSGTQARVNWPGYCSSLASSRSNRAGCCCQPTTLSGLRPPPGRFGPV